MFNAYTYTDFSTQALGVSAIVASQQGQGETNSNTSDESDEKTSDMDKGVINSSSQDTTQNLFHDKGTGQERDRKVNNQNAGLLPSNNDSLKFLSDGEILSSSIATQTTGESNDLSNSNSLLEQIIEHKKINVDSIVKIKKKNIEFIHFNTEEIED